MNNQKDSKIKKIKKYVKEYYGLEGPVINIQSIKSRPKYKQYLIKEPFDDYFYYDEYNEKTIEQLECEASDYTKKKCRCTCKIIECPSCVSIHQIVAV